MFDSHYPFRKVSSEFPKGEPFHTVHRLTFRGFNKQRYIVLVEEYPLDVFALKFYLYAHRLSDKKYQLLTGFHDATRIIRTCIEIFLHFYQANNEASFGFIGSSLIDETLNETKRYRVYSQVMKNFFSPLKFEHRYMPEKSVYLILNKSKNMEELVQVVAGILEGYQFE